MKRTQLILGGLLLLQLVLILVFRSPLSGASQRAEPRPLVPVLEAITASRLQLTEPADDLQLTLVRSGETWQVEEIGGFPADGNKVNQLLDDLEQVTVRRPVVKSSRYHKAFQVTDDDNEARLRVWDESDDDPRVDLIFGSSSNYRAIHVRLADEDPVYEVRGIASYDVQANPNGWIETDLVDADPETITGFRLTNSAGTFDLEKQDGTWKVLSPERLAEAELDQEKIATLVRAAATIRMADGIGPVNDDAHGFASAAASAELRSDTGTVTVQVGGQVEEKDSQRYVTRAGFGFTGTVWETSVETLIEEKLDDLTL